MEGAVTCASRATQGVSVCGAEAARGGPCVRSPVCLAEEGLLPSTRLFLIHFSVRMTAPESAEKTAACFCDLCYAETEPGATVKCAEVSCTSRYRDLSVCSTYHSVHNQGHPVCYECAQTGIKTLLDRLDNSDSLACLAVGDCEAEYSHEDARKFLGPDLIEQMNKLQLDKAIASLPGFRSCPFCSFGIEMETPDAQEVLNCQNPVSRARTWALPVSTSSTDQG